jgi:hypothetical protein
MRVLCARTLVSAFWLLSALLALLSAIPFAFTQFLEPQLVPAVTLFAAWHPWLSVAVLGATLGALAPWLRARRAGAVALAGAWALSIVLEFATGGFAALSPSPVALAVSLAALLPPVWLAMLGLDGPHRGSTPRNTTPLADFLACAAAALLIVATHAALAWPGLETSAWLAGVGRSTVLHLLVFSGAFALLSLVRGAAQRSRQPRAAEAWLARIVLAVVFALFMRVVLAALSFTGGQAVVVAAAFGIALAIVFTPGRGGSAGGVDDALSGFAPRWAVASPGAAIVWIVLAMAAVAGLERAIAQSDWDFTIAKLIALGSWLIALSTMLRLVPARPAAAVPSHVASIAPFVACVLVLGVQQYTAGAAAVSPDSPLAAWTGRDVSSRLITDALTPAAETDAGIYRYLQANTNIPRTAAVTPVAVTFAPLRGRSGVKPPHLFVFVIDSLRRDYLSAYNDRVAFTPAIGRFAAESTVFERAFTRYGGTGLAVPSIWVGGLVLHKQYVTPFAPMNALNKLLDAEGYAKSIGMEHIVKTVLPANATVTTLDEGVPVKDHRLCRTLAEVRGRLASLAADPRPAFVYSLPQDVHIATINREGAGPVDAGDYAGFNAAYASRVHRLDTCFGEFITDLKARGLYDDSLIVVTSDHGDSLGEQGRVGHAYTIFPEIVQVPLLVHLPASMRATVTTSPTAVAFTSDITPSLYALLGHAPTPPSWLFGQPLFYPRGAAPPARRGPHVVASSYGSVYGALLDDARRLYIIDAVSLRDHLYELDGSAAGRPVTVGPRERADGQRAVRAAVDEIARFYRYRFDAAAATASGRRPDAAAIDRP